MKFQESLHYKRHIFDSIKKMFPLVDWLNVYLNENVINNTLSFVPSFKNPRENVTEESPDKKHAEKENHESVRNTFSPNFHRRHNHLINARLSLRIIIR